LVFGGGLEQIYIATGAKLGALFWATILGELSTYQVWAVWLPYFELGPGPDAGGFNLHYAMLCIYRP
jgi:hypothetical protein